MDTLGMRIRKQREELELSQLEIAQMLNCSHKMISNYELDKRSPDYEILIKMCNIFNVSADFLLGRVDTPQFFFQSVLTNEEIQLLKYFKKLPKEYKNHVLHFSKLNLLDYQNTKKTK